MITMYFIWENKTQCFFLLISAQAIPQEMYQGNSIL